MNDSAPSSWQKQRRKYLKALCNLEKKIFFSHCMIVLNHGIAVSIICELEIVLKDIRSTECEWQGMIPRSIWELSEDWIISVIWSKILEFNKTIWNFISCSRGPKMHTCAKNGAGIFFHQCSKSNSSKEVGLYIKRKDVFIKEDVIKGVLLTKVTWYLFFPARDVSVFVFRNETAYGPQGKKRWAIERNTAWKLKLISTLIRRRDSSIQQLTMRINYDNRLCQQVKFCYNKLPTAGIQWKICHICMNFVEVEIIFDCKIKAWSSYFLLLLSIHLISSARFNGLFVQKILETFIFVGWLIGFMGYQPL